jgi:hypothetical protein
VRKQGRRCCRPLLSRSPETTTQRPAQNQSPTLSSTAIVVTTRPERYLKQLASHLAQRIPVVQEGPRTMWTFPFGGCVGTATAETIEFRAEATTLDDLVRIEDVIGRHLERFGARDTLVVRWSRT